MPTSVTPRSPAGDCDDVVSSERARPTTRRHRRTFGHVRRLPSKRYQASYLGPDGQRRVAPSMFHTKTDQPGSRDGFRRWRSKVQRRQEWTL